MTQPLEGLRIVDFSTLLPGPLASLMLAEAGAEVIRIERPESGDPMRHMPPRRGGESLPHALLNAGKKSIALDLKDPAAPGRLMPLIARADVLIEQFRPGVMDRLGLGYEALRKVNPRLIYCSISGYGQNGPKCNLAGHDINYVAEAGILSLSTGPGARPTMPFAQIADVGGGSLPAVLNILLALQMRERTGQGTHLDIAMAEGALGFGFLAHAGALAGGQGLENGGGMLSGGLARYNLYSTEDGRILALGALEEKFWKRFCALIELPEALRSLKADQQAARAEVARRIRARPAAEWARIFEAADCCVSIAKSPEEALNDRHFAARGVYGRRIALGGERLPALPLPIAPQFRAPESRVPAAPALGQDAAEIAPEGEGDKPGRGRE